MFLAPGGRRAGWGALRALIADPGARWRAVSMVLTAIQTVFGKAAINLSSAIDLFLAWSFASAVVAAAIWFFQDDWRDELQKTRGQWMSVVLLAILFLVLALLSSLIFEQMFVGYALALFQLSALVNVALGWRMFSEGHVATRAFGSSVMVLGAVILILWG
jgi:drug/metabolite transporter (DMT)-like permease